MKLRMAGYQDARSVHTRAMRVLEASLKQSLGDGIAVEFEENIAARGRKVADLLDLVESGALDLCYFSSSYLTARVPALGVFDIPFMLTGRGRTRALLQGTLGARIADEIASSHRLHRAGLLGQRAAQHLQPAAADPQAGGLQGHPHPHAAERRLPCRVPRARHGAGDDRHPRFRRGDCARNGRRAGKSADQHAPVRPAGVSPPRHHDRAFSRHRAAALQREDARRECA